jgi:hypothetical protein
MRRRRNAAGLAARVRGEQITLTSCCSHKPSTQQKALPALRATDDEKRGLV